MDGVAMNGRQRFMTTLAGGAVDRPPVWMMRQAGRTLPEYRALRAEHSFLTVLRDPDLATEVTLQPVRRFGLDAAIIFCDILIIPEAFGQELRFEKGVGPRLAPVVRHPDDLARLRRADPATDYAPLLQALRQTKAALDGGTALLGFAGAPFTLATYMVEGGSTRTFSCIKRFLFTYPAAADDLLSRLADAVADLLIAQYRAGADAVQLFDTWAGELSAADYERFAAPYNRRIIAAVRAAGAPIMLFLRNGHHLLDSALSSGATGLALDWRMPLSTVIGRAAALPLEQRPMVLQGNLDPIALFAPAAEIGERVRALHAEVGGRTAHIMNLGHGLHPETPIEGIQAFVDAVKELA
jgi:uroporphyrinogen decarboxylase